MDTLLARVTSHICLITGIKEGLNYIRFRVGGLKATPCDAPNKNTRADI